MIRVEYLLGRAIWRFKMTNKIFYYTGDRTQVPIKSETIGLNNLQVLGFKMK